MDNYKQSFSELEEYFSARNIPTETVGFFDDPSFIAHERQEPLILCRYARFVITRPRTSLYDSHVRQTVPIVTDILHRELVSEGRLGACVDMSSALQRILDAEGIWSYCVSGGVRISFEKKHKLEDVYFYPIDVSDITGHAWVAAPPYDIIDVTLRQQPFFQPAARNHLPQVTLFDKIIEVEVSPSEVCSPEIRAAALLNRQPLQKIINRRMGGVNIFSALPVNQQNVNGTTLKYMPFGAHFSDGPLQKITNQKWNGRLSHEIYEDLIKPALSIARQVNK